MKLYGFNSSQSSHNCDHIMRVNHYNDVIMSAMASQITSPTIVIATICSGADQRKHQSSASLAFVREIHWWSVNSPHRRPVTRKMFLFDDVIMMSWSSKSKGPSLGLDPRQDCQQRKIIAFRPDMLCLVISKIVTRSCHFFHARLTRFLHDLGYKLSVKQFSRPI